MITSRLVAFAISLLLVFLSDLPVIAQEPPSTRAQSASPQLRDALSLADVWLDTQVIFDRIPALSAGVVIGEELAWEKGYGTIDKAAKVPARSDTIYGICSISKLFTSVAIMQLWEAGKLSLDEDVTKALPSFDIRRDIPDSGPITIRALLTHSSGLPREADRSYWTPPDFDFPTRAQLFSALRDQHVFMRPSERWQYSNLGMAILGEAVSELSRMPYASYIKDRILVPLRLEDTRPAMPHELYGTRLAQGFGALKRDGTRDLLKLYDAKGLAPAAGFSSTVEDLARFVSWQFHLREAGGREILRASTLRDMQRVQWMDSDGKRKAGLGFDIDGHDEPDTMVGHEGSCPGYETMLRLALTDKVAVIVLTNATDAPVPALVKAMMKLILKGLRFPNAAQSAEQLNLTPYVGHYARQPWAADEVVVPWGTQLAVLDLPTDDPSGSMIVLQNVSKDIFRVVRDDNSLADEVVFQRDTAGHVIGLTRWNQWRPQLSH